MEPPRSYKDVQKLTGRLAALISKGPVSSVLLREERGVQKPIYYVSHILHGREENYPLIDKFVLTLVTSARKLKAYFQAHPIKVTTDQPIKGVVSSPTHSGRLTTWAVELSEFEINYAPRVGIKAPVLADFIVENNTHMVDEVPSQERTFEEAPKWTLYVDRASNDKGAGAGILIQGVDGEQFEYALCFSFKATNNEAEYEVMVSGLLMAKALDINCLKVRGDSKLVIEQVDIRKSPAYEEIAIMRVMEEEEDWRSPIALFIFTS
ncbi:hypothetical protein LIER_39945 [Lithospermum erythrorhizon]|uniref:Reverse transcriptase RNase H-like domain-containing protein n=1 Tax=Lithospermum erythrorhizon TaxID=34254 RepID=A0AAV3QQA3_LITER